MHFLHLFIAFTLGWLAASFVAQITGYNVAAYFFKGEKYVEEEAKADISTIENWRKKL